MQPKPKRNIRRCETTLNGLKEVAPDANFGGYKAADFEVVVQQMRDAREDLDDLQTRIKAALARRDLVDEAGLKAEQLIVNAIIGDRNHGPDSPLYGAIGRTRKSERRSGLKRKKKPETAG